MDTLHPHHILIIEDHDRTREALVILLEAAGYKVTAAAHGQEALDLFIGSEPPSLILLDLVMPVMDGPTFRKHQLRSSSLASIPVILLSSEGNLAGISASLGTAGYFLKPIDIEVLLEAIHAFETLAN